MAEKETVNEPKDLIEPVPEELEKLEVKFMSRAEKEKEESSRALASWVPKTQIGRDVKSPSRRCSL